METYTLLRYLADSWALLVLTLIFLFVIAWAFRPGSRPLHDDAADVPFRNDDEKPRGPKTTRARAAAHTEKGRGDV
ncbi:cbb3-type cytochrome c oxidase subunit 3 [Roseovarius sp. D0-M9]|uniref:cbb3-type cytochrome c oxidase subunit 3 n=1 Tax=Roseovarius sp. D0-M9 TaxID=3127117 RepID=UPI00300FDBA7